MWGAIKKAINSNLNKPLDTLISEKTGNTNDTGGSYTAGTIFAKLNSILGIMPNERAVKIDRLDANITSRAAQGTADSILQGLGDVNTKVNALYNGRVVKSVQRGIFEGYSSSDVIINHNYVDLNKSVLILGGSTITNGSPNIAISARFKTRESTNFVLSDTGARNSYTSWEIIEFY